MNILLGKSWRAAVAINLLLALTAGLAGAVINDDWLSADAPGDAGPDDGGGERLGMIRAKPPPATAPHVVQVIGEGLAVRRQ